MIEVNLIPDVKLELLKVRRQRRMVTTGAIFTTLVAGGLVVLLSTYAFGVQAIAGTVVDGTIKTESKKLQSVEDLEKTLTIQTQLGSLKQLHDEKHISSRIFEIIATAVPSGENSILISRLSLDTDEKVVTIEGEAVNGYEALEVFKKTIEQTTFEYDVDGEPQTGVAIASRVSDGERRYGESTTGQRVLRFTLSFEYPEQLFERQSQNGKIIGPNQQNVTDSARGVPESLFTNGAEGTN